MIKKLIINLYLELFKKIHLYKLMSIILSSNSSPIYQTPLNSAIIQASPIIQSPVAQSPIGYFSQFNKISTSLKSISACNSYGWKYC